MKVRTDKYGKDVKEGDQIISKGFVHEPYIVTLMPDGELGIRHPKNTGGIHITESAWSNVEVINGSK